MASVSGAETRAVLTTRPAFSEGLLMATKSPTRRPFTVKLCSTEVLTPTEATSSATAHRPKRSSLIMAPMGDPPLFRVGDTRRGAAPDPVQLGSAKRDKQGRRFTLWALPKRKGPDEAAPGFSASAVGQPAGQLRADGLEAVEDI